jgi:ATP-independent RNA helicase DbpA
VDKNNFSKLNISKELLLNLESLNFNEMTPIQAESLPAILAGKDVIAQAKTGSGKTAAFALGLLSNLNISDRRTQSLVLCPTRELAEQVSVAIRQLARTLPNVKVLTLCGGAQYRAQVASLAHGAHIVVGTPGRIAKHLRKETLKLNALKMLVLDEGDRMLEMGFQDEVDSIIDMTPSKKQTLLFSATYPEKIQLISKRIMSQPVMVKVESKHDTATITQHFYKVSDVKGRMEALGLIIMHYRPESTIIFCNTKRDVVDVCEYMTNEGFSALELHGGLEQYDRDEALIKFSNKSVSILVATDVAARGLDIESVDCIINYHITRDFEVHIHRIGRTGQAGGTGIACSLFAEKEHYKIKQLEEFLEDTITLEELPHKSVMKQQVIIPKMTTILLNVGKKQKIRPGNIMGAFTGKTGLKADEVGKIKVCDNNTYVAVATEAIDFALKKIRNETWKGRGIKAKLI